MSPPIPTSTFAPSYLKAPSPQPRGPARTHDLDAGGDRPPITRLLDRLDNVRGGHGEWSARCPAHDDARNSLSITEASDGTVLIYCHAGCESEFVVATVGLQMRDLFPPKAPAPRSIAACYDYTDEEGQLLFQVVRFRPKGFLQRVPTGPNQWRWQLGGVRRVPYRLPELRAAIRAAQTVFIVEGEKDVDNLVQQGLAATTNPGGAGTWLAEFNTLFDGARVVLLPDNDEAGRKHAERIAVGLSSIAAEVKVVELPGLPSKGDVSDWLASGGTAARLEQLAADAPAWRPDSSTPPVRPDRRDQRFRLLTDIELETMPRPEYAVEGIYPAGGLVVLFGPPGAGKTFVSLDLALCHATGLPWMGRSAKRGPVVYVAAEGLSGLGARISAWKEHRGWSGQAGVHCITEPVNLMDSREVDQFLDSIAGLPEKPVVVFIDTLARNMVGDENSAREMGQFIAGADRIRSITGATVVVIHHCGHAGDRERGSTALLGAADTRIAVRPKDDQRFQLVCMKQKDGGEFAPMSLRLVQCMDSCVVAAAIDEQRGPATAEWLTENERTALATLAGFPNEDGATATEWCERSGLPNSTFYAVREKLMSRQLVDGPAKPMRGAHYRLTAAGLSGIAPSSN